MSTYTLSKEILDIDNAVDSNAANTLRVHGSEELANNRTVGNTIVLQTSRTAGLAHVQTPLALGIVPLLLELVDHANEILDDERSAYVLKDVNAIVVGLPLAFGGQTLVAGEQVGDVITVHLVGVRAAVLHVEGITVEKAVKTLDPGSRVAHATGVPADDVVVPLTRLVKCELQVLASGHSELGTWVTRATRVDEDATSVRRVVDGHDSGEHLQGNGHGSRVGLILVVVRDLETGALEDAAVAVGPLKVLSRCDGAPVEGRRLLLALGRRGTEHDGKARPAKA